MGVIDAIFTKYRYLLYPSMIFLLSMAYRINRFHHLSKDYPKPIKDDILSPIIIAIAMYIMHSARRQADLDGIDNWTWKFYLAEISYIFAVDKTKWSVRRLPPT